MREMTRGGEQVRGAAGGAAGYLTPPPPYCCPYPSPYRTHSPSIAAGDGLRGPGGEPAGAHRHGRLARKHALKAHRLRRVRSRWCCPRDALHSARRHRAASPRSLLAARHSLPLVNPALTPSAALLPIAPPRKHLLEPALPARAARHVLLCLQLQPEAELLRRVRRQPRHLPHAAAPPSRTVSDHHQPTRAPWH